MNSKKDEITAKKLVEIFLPKLWIIAIVSIVFAALFGGYSELFEKDTYTSSGKFMVIKIPYDDDDSRTTGLNANEITAMQGMIANAKEIINTKDFCDSVKERVSADLSSGQLMAAMSVSLSNAETTCYFFDVKTNDPRWSYEIAEVAGELLRQQFIDMGYAIKIVRIDSPRVAASADPKNTTRNAILGFAAGFILSLLCVFFISKFDVVIRSKEKLESNFEVPILGVIPKPELANGKLPESPRNIFGKKRKDFVMPDVGLIDENSPFAIREAYKSLYTNIVYIGVDDKCKKLVVTSALPSEGKSTVSANLAYAIARNSENKRVLIIDADMRAPKVNTLFNIDENERGLSEFLAGVDEKPNFIHLKDKNVTVLTAGGRSVNPTQLLSSSMMAQLFAECERRFDYIIIDTPPVNIVTDAVLFNNYVNGYIISTLSEYSETKSVAECHNKLTQVGAEIIGHVFSGVKLKNYAGNYRYSKHYQRYAGEH